MNFIKHEYNQIISNNNSIDDMIRTWSSTINAKWNESLKRWEESLKDNQIVELAQKNNLINCEPISNVNEIFDFNKYNGIK